MGVEYEVQASKFNLSINGRFGSVFLVQFWAPLRGKEENKITDTKANKKGTLNGCLFLGNHHGLAGKCGLFIETFLCRIKLPSRTKEMCRKKKSLGLGLGETVGLPEIGPWNKTPVTSSLSL